MKIENISIKSDGFIYCKSSFYSAQDTINECDNYEFTVGTNELIGDIDSGNWGISYLISMYPYFSRLDKKGIFLSPSVFVNGEELSIDKLTEYSCYMDDIYPMFSKKTTIRKLVSKGIKKNGLNLTPEDVRNIFYMNPERFERPLCGVGNEVFKAMAAIGYCEQKQVFCFPWQSQKRFDSYHYNLIGLLEVLKSLNKIVILPIGK